MTAPTTTSASQPPDFTKAGRSHYHAAMLASGGELRIAADHLAGLAAECAIKAILIDFLGSRLNAYNRPFNAEVKILDRSKKKPFWTDKHGHLPELWEHLTAVANRRQSAAAGVLFAELVWKNPFADWDVGDRYCDGTAITQQNLDRHLKAAHDLIAAHEQACILGTGPLV
ncbi:hypothetical protein ACFVRU_04145 [Streptomyces sp. NPDC057927]